jgi:small-conductance mechanosensitive channel
VSKNELVREL